MADIRAYHNNRKGKRKQQVSVEAHKNATYEDKLKRHKRGNAVRILLVLGIGILLVAAFWLQYVNRVYQSYDVQQTVKRNKAASAKEIMLEKSVVTYSRDGAKCTNMDGEDIWNQSYEIQDIKVVSCKDTVAIGSINGRNIYVMNGEKILGTIHTNLPIKNLAVAENGNVTAILEDTNVTWMNTYSCDGKLLYEGQAHMKEGGYPFSLSLSPNGQLLLINYLFVEEGLVKNNIAFYNLGPVGANQSDYLVSSFPFTNTIMPTVHFMNDEASFAVGDDRIVFFIGSNRPEAKETHMYSGRVQSVFYNEEHVGLVFLSDKTEYKYKMDLYNNKGIKSNTYYFDMEYTNIVFEKNSFYIYNNKQCRVMTYGGAVKFEGDFLRPINLMVPGKYPYRYVLYSDISIDTIRLVGEKK